MLTFDKFRALPRSEQERRYCELSDHDQFLARMNDWGAPDKSPGYKPKPFDITQELVSELFGAKGKRDGLDE